MFCNPQVFLNNLPFYFIGLVLVVAIIATLGAFVGLILKIVIDAYKGK